ncbi:hypothetical protein OIU84_028804 [Salix udensis]|uniref:Uncharacterized protein n=1 Tax=Salix udensis TaxID=889485 RepID=A0AAD6KFE1_9ROSI|nr:hypothetical protein OIU84_028804 [Salix udensis]
MDPYKHISGAEGCSSSESGWTMYLASPMQEDEDDEGSYDGGNNSEAAHMARYKNQYAAVEDEVSDDSMASDASSGPHHQNNHENGHGTVSFKHSKGGHFNPPIFLGQKTREKGQEE